MRANSDNSMNVPDWIAFPNAAGSNIVSVQVIYECVCVVFFFCVYMYTIIQKFGVFFFFK